eukprot:4092981-Amphidinium_carterae.1
MRSLAAEECDNGCRRIVGHFNPQTLHPTQRAQRERTGLTDLLRELRFKLNEACPGKFFANSRRASSHKGP